jgi:benzoyl-CoA reductase/2-hydroxyglutaryl-CoA dehydratase subunit BcrC/BadD/HgdB
VKDLIKELKSAPSETTQAYKPRLMVIGSELDSFEYIKVIEDAGGLVVTDDLCCGTRYFWDLVEEDSDPMEALAVRYLTKTPCARMHPAMARTARLIEMAKEFAVDGVIYQSIKFCDLHAGVYPVIKNEFAKVGIPVLQLEKEYVLAGTGQINTRVGAFLEMLE